MQELKIETKFHCPAFAGLLHGLTGVLQQLDKEVVDAIHLANVEATIAYSSGQRDALNAIVYADEGWQAANVIVNEDISLLTDLMSPSGWESTETPTGGCGDSISYSSSKIPSGYEFSEPWVQVIFDNLAEDTVELINTFFEEKGA